MFLSDKIKYSLNEQAERSYSQHGVMDMSKNSEGDTIKKPSSVLNSPSACVSKLPDGEAKSKRGIDIDTEVEGATLHNSLLLHDEGVAAKASNLLPHDEDAGAESDIESDAESEITEFPITSEKDLSEPKSLALDLKQVTAACKYFGIVQKPIPSVFFEESNLLVRTATLLGSTCIIDGVPSRYKYKSTKAEAYFQADERIDIRIARDHIFQVIFFRYCNLRSWMVRDLLLDPQSNTKIASPTDPEWFSDMRCFKRRIFHSITEKATCWLVSTIQYWRDNNLQHRATIERAAAPLRQNFWNQQLSPNDLIAIW